MLNHVVVDGAGLELQSNILQNESGTLKHASGVVTASDITFDWIMINASGEPDLTNRLSSPPGEDVIVEGGGANAFFNAGLIRLIEAGNTPEGGYFFPVGSAASERPDDPVQVDRYRPTTLKFDAPLDQFTAGRVDYRPGGLQLQPLQFDKLETFGPGGEPLVLDQIGEDVWVLQFSETAVPPDGLDLTVQLPANPRVLEPNTIRIIKFDCDGNVIGEAGLFVPPDDPVNGTSVVNGVPRIVHSDVDVDACQILALGADGSINPVEEGLTSSVATVQILNIAPDLPGIGPGDPIAAFPNGRRLSDDVLQGAGSPFFVTPIEEPVIDIVEVGATDNSSPALQITPELAGSTDNVILLDGIDAIGPFMVDRSPPDAGEVLMNVINMLDEDVTAVVPGLSEIPIVAGQVGQVRVRADAEQTVSIFGSGGLLELVSFTSDLRERDLQVLIVPVLVSPPGKRDAASALVIDAYGAPLDNRITTGVEDFAPSEIPNVHALHQNYPNPFNPSTVIRYDIAGETTVRLSVFDALGRQVTTLVDQSQRAGSYTLSWDSHDDVGMPVTSGIYLARLEAGDRVFTRKMLLVR